MAVSRFRYADSHLLSPRELDVAHLLCTGLTNQQIADKLYVCVKTVKFHLYHIYTKTGMKSRSAFILATFTRKLEKETQAQVEAHLKKNGLHIAKAKA